MILVVGHGPSADIDPEWIDAQDFVVRCHTGTHKQEMCRHEKLHRSKKPRKMYGHFVPHVGSKVDAVCTTRPFHIFNNAEVWYEADYRERLRELADPFTTKKLSSGANGCLIARMKFPGAEIGVIGFDTTMAGIYFDNWPYHDAEGERELLLSIGIKDYGIYGEDV